MGRKRITKVRLRRVSQKMVDELNEIKRMRYNNKLDKKISYDSELSEMIINAPSWRKLKRELVTLPKMEDIR